MHLAAVLTAPLFARYGAAIGPKLLYNLGGLAQDQGDHDEARRYRAEAVAALEAEL